MNRKRKATAWRTGGSVVVAVKVVRRPQSSPRARTPRAETSTLTSMAGLQRALEIHRYTPSRPVHFIVGELAAELRSRGHDPGLNQLTADVIKECERPGNHHDRRALRRLHKRFLLQIGN